MYVSNTFGLLTKNTLQISEFESSTEFMWLAEYTQQRLWRQKKTPPQQPKEWSLF